MGINKGLLQMAEGTVIFLFQYGKLSTLNLDCHKMTVKIEIIAIGDKCFYELFDGVQKDVINHVGDKFDLPSGWLNADFMRIDSYSPKLDEISVYYKTFYGVLAVRTVAAEYLIAMKLSSGRKYKNDLSDIIGILAEHEKRETPITFEKIEKTVDDLYGGGWDGFSEDSKPFIEDALKHGDFENVYRSVNNDEIESKDILIDFEK